VYLTTQRSTSLTVQ